MLRRTAHRARLSLLQILCKDSRLGIPVERAHMLIHILLSGIHLIIKQILLLCFVHRLLSSAVFHEQSAYAIQIVNSVSHLLPRCRDCNYFLPRIRKLCLLLPQLFYALLFVCHKHSALLCLFILPLQELFLVCNIFSLLVQFLIVWKLVIYNCCLPLELFCLWERFLCPV